MAYAIHYFRAARQLRLTPAQDSLTAAIEAAEAGLITHGADFFRIVDVDGSCAEVASGNRRRSDRS